VAKKQLLQVPETLTERFAARQDDLTGTERRVIEHLLAAEPDVVLRSAAALARDLEVSDATIVRAAQALGYAGLHEMRQALARRPEQPTLAQRLTESLAVVGDADHLFQVGLRQHLDALSALARAIPPAHFDAAVELLCEGQRSVWCGSGPSAALADYAALLSRRAGRPALSCTATGSAFADDLVQLASGDVVVVLAYGAVSRQVRVLLDRIALLGLHAVLITDVLGRTVGDGVDVTLSGGRGTPGLVASHAATMFLVEQLILGVAAGEPARAEAILAELDEARAALGGGARPRRSR